MSRAAGGKKFGKLDVKRVYFGNWLRDYSQAVYDTLTVYVKPQADEISEMSVPLSTLVRRRSESYYGSLVL